MPALTQQNCSARDFFALQFAPRFPGSMKSLQHVALAAAKVHKNFGKVGWFGKDKGKQAYDEFLNAFAVLGSRLQTEGYFHVASGSTEMEKTFNLLRFFFVAYPNWHDAMQFLDDFERWIATQS